MGLKNKIPICLVVCVLAYRLVSVKSENCRETQCQESFEIPLLNKLNAPLQATLDMTKFNMQLETLINKKVKAGIEKEIGNLVENKFKELFAGIENTVMTWNTTIEAIQKHSEGNFILFFFMKIEINNTFPNTP